MQRSNFNELMNEDSKAEFLKAFDIQDISEAKRKEFNDALLGLGDKSPSQMVAENETIVPVELTAEMKAYIKILRDKNTKERQVRRKVKAKFGIVIVPDNI